jgi:Xaa-Pro dipeptidase
MCFKEVTQKQREVYALVREANEAAQAIAGPGVLLSELDRAARGCDCARRIRPPTLPTGWDMAVGWNAMSLQNVSEVSDIEAQPGMVFSIEPGIYLPGEFGVRIEDLVSSPKRL